MSSVQKYEYMNMSTLAVYEYEYEYWIAAPYLACEASHHRFISVAVEPHLVGAEVVGQGEKNLPVLWERTIRNTDQLIQQP